MRWNLRGFDRLCPRRRLLSGRSGWSVDEGGCQLCHRGVNQECTGPGADGPGGTRPGPGGQPA